MNLTATPERSLEQRRAALDRANHVRTQRALLKRRLKNGTADPMHLLHYPPQFVKSMRVRDLILALPKYGEVKTDRLMRVAGISPGKTLKGMTDRQRSELVMRMGERG